MSHPMTAGIFIKAMLRGTLSSFIALAFIFGGCADPAKPTDPAAVIRAAWSDFRIGQFDSAALKFQSVADSANAQFRHSALYGLAPTLCLRRADSDP